MVAERVPNYAVLSQDVHLCPGGEMGALWYVGCLCFGVPFGAMATFAPSMQTLFTRGHATPGEMEGGDGFRHGHTWGLAVSGFAKRVLYLTSGLVVTARSVSLFRRLPFPFCAIRAIGGLGSGAFLLGLSIVGGVCASECLTCLCDCVQSYVGSALRHFGGGEGERRCYANSVAGGLFRVCQRNIEFGWILTASQFVPEGSSCCSLVLVHHLVTGWIGSTFVFEAGPMSLAEFSFPSWLCEFSKA